MRAAQAFNDAFAGFDATRLATNRMARAPAKFKQI